MNKIYIILVLSLCAAYLINMDAKNAPGEFSGKTARVANSYKNKQLIDKLKNADFAYVLDADASNVEEKSKGRYFRLFPLLGDSIKNYRINNKLFGKQRHEIDTLRYGVNQVPKYPNPNFSGAEYSELTRLLEDVPEIVLHHCIWSTYTIDIWVAEQGDSTIFLCGNVHKALCDK